MKRFLSFLMLFLLMLSVALSANADFQNPSITDKAGYLLKWELEELSEKLDNVRKKYDFEVAIYTEGDMTSLSAQASADDIYDYQSYGAGANHDGIMLYICSSTREYHFTTHGKGLEYFNSNGLNYMESKVVPHLSEDNYYEAFEAYIETSDELLRMAFNGNPYNEKEHSTKSMLGIFLVLLIAPLLIAFRMMQKKLKQMKTAMENNYAANYVKEGSQRINVSKDIFLYSHITKTEKSKNSSGSHVSSSGRTHGGSGGSF